MGGSRRGLTELEHQLAERDRLLTAAQARIVALEAEATALRSRLGQIASLASEAPPLGSPAMPDTARPVPLPSSPASKNPASVRSASPDVERPPAQADGHGALHPAARKLLGALAQHAPARFTWGQVATLAGLKPSGGHYNAGRKQLRDLGLAEEATDLVAVSPVGMEIAGEVPPAPSSAEERLALWCSRLPSPAPEMLRTLAAQSGRYVEPTELASALGKKATGGHWNSGIALLRNNGLVEVSGKLLRVSELFR